jgi:hypothetical protein
MGVSQAFFRHRTSQKRRQGGISPLPPLFASVHNFPAVLPFPFSAPPSGGGFPLFRDMYGQDDPVSSPLFLERSLFVLNSSTFSPFLQSIFEKNHSFTYYFILTNN